MTKGRTYRVKDVARIAGVSVRALHHYDEMGLLAPSGRSEAGYRLYGERKEIAELFEGFDPSRYEDEAKERWGETDAYKESARRTGKYTKADWERYKAESHAIMTDAARLFRSGAAADADEAMTIAERHRLSIDSWFYPCGPSMHAGLADMYDADERFASSIDKYAPGLTVWWSSAIRANARR